MKKKKNEMLYVFNDMKPNEEGRREMTKIWKKIIEEEKSEIYTNEGMIIYD